MVFVVIRRLEIEQQRAATVIGTCGGSEERALETMRPARLQDAAWRHARRAVGLQVDRQHIDEVLDLMRRRQLAQDFRFSGGQNGSEPLRIAFRHGSIVRPWRDVSRAPRIEGWPTLE